MPVRLDASAQPTRRDPVAAAASEVVGGRLGRHAAVGRRTRAGWRPVAAVLVGLSGVVLALGVLQKAHCLESGWRTPDQFWHACYSDLPVVYQSSGLSAGVMPYLGSAAGRFLDQPVVSGLAMWAVGLLAPNGPGVPLLAGQQWYFGLWAALIALILALLVVVTVASCRRLPWSAAHVALSPVLVTAALVSVDLLGVLLTSLALWAWGRSRVPLAGVLFGLSVATRSYPVVILAAIGLLALRTGRLGSWGVLAGTALATWLVVNLPWLVLSAGALTATYRTWWRAAAGYGSPWLVPGLAQHPLPVGVVTGLAVAGWLVALAVGAVLALAPGRRPTVAQVSLVMLAIVIVTGKAVPPQEALWLLPLVALTGMRWRDHLVWAAAEAAYFVAVWLYIGGIGSNPDRELPPGTYILFLVARLAAVLFLAAQGSRTPRVQVDGSTGFEGDELAGPLDEAPDRVLLRLT